MKELEKKKLLIKGLDCAHCASKIETALANIEGIYNVALNFVNETLYFEMENNANTEEIITKIKTTINKLEPNAVIIDNEKLIEKKQNKDINNIKSYTKLIRILITFILLGCALFLNLNSTLTIILFLSSYIVIGFDVLYKAINNIKNGHIFDENFLMSLATIGAFIIGEYTEAVAVMIFYQIGEYFQDRAVNNSRKSIADMMNIKPEYANLEINGIIKKVSPEDVKVGEIIVIKPGEKVPLDGKVVKGNSMLDTSSLTGESIHREVKEGNDILSGSINLNGLLTISVTKKYKDSLVSKILELVQNASSRKANTENFITKFARYYTPAVVIVAMIIAIIPPLFIQNSTFSEWIYKALIFLVVSCPCALVISIPLSFFGGIGGASRNGILVKGGNYLEALNNTETVVFDKTGTLTKGFFEVTEIISVDKNYKNEDILKYAAYAESFSNHPVAKSVLKKYKNEINKNEISNYVEIPGQGIKANVKGKQIIIGNTKLLDNENVKYSITDSVGAVLYVAINNQYVGYIVVSDEIKEDAKKTIQGLKSLNINKLVMLTGDIEAVGKKVSTDLGIETYYTELLPNNKVEIFEELYKQKSSKGKIIYVGDGINDAPVLARADIGIAMGGIGSDAAIEAADVVIMTDEPSKIVKAINIAKITKKIVWQNIIFALGIKALVMILGVIGIATMWEAVFADVGVAFIAILNSIRVIKS